MGQSGRPVLHEDALGSADRRGDADWPRSGGASTAPVFFSETITSGAGGCGFVTFSVYLAKPLRRADDRLEHLTAYNDRLSPLPRAFVGFSSFLRRPAEDADQVKKVAGGRDRKALAAGRLAAFTEQLHVGADGLKTIPRSVQSSWVG